MNVILLGLGIFYFLEGAANLLYWKGSRQPNNLVWQYGRAARMFGGIGLQALGVLL